MNFNIEEGRGYNYRRDKEEEHEQSSEELREVGIGGGEEEEETTTRNYTTSKLIPFPSATSTASSSSNTSPPFSYKNFLPSLPFPYSTSAPVTDLSLGNARMGGVEEGDGGVTSVVTVEKEHMFDKVVTPSDVGKLNRLVIPKQHAEKYFPLDSSSNEKGLLLNFEDRNGKPWRFRYSYWNSSQSYVMTKGWSRFVKEKKLDAGDIVSFQRGVGEEGSHRLFIDWRRRPSVSAHLEFQNQLNVRWGNRLLYSLPHLQNPPPPPPQFHYSLTGYNVQPQPFAARYQFYGRSNPAPYYVKPAGVVGGQNNNVGEGRPLMGGSGVDHDVSPMVIDSVPVVQGRTVGKRLRLFGVNMDCPIVPSSDLGDDDLSSINLVGKTAHGLIPPRMGSSSSPGNENSYATSYGQLHGAADASSLQLRLPSGSGVPVSTVQSHELSKKGKISLSFDLDL